MLDGIGARAGPKRASWVAGGEERTRRVGAAARQLDGRPWLLTAADFVPWGRTVLMFAAGVLRFRPRRFVLFAGIGAVAWSVFYSLLGLLGGSVFESTWQSLAASIGVVFLIAAVTELVRRLRTSDPREQEPETDRERVPAGV